ncbi:hypothetical protein CYLTODRAFT_457256 [Cylindrobasidium torrendii FP15055 ss-10]|uniref:Uncharacterized protein n=1 Tax=Cylindrobasidium torrendii FP15055 ss-10 TaxID=1314674 RepID=A0A0D7B2G3_9AGAR|nr:hypothetical protein CYLTODRAFT_457256 [Cylindrobasidium torrendii FP15055 ss-10]
MPNVPTSWERQKYALEALDLENPAQFRSAGGLRDARSTREPDKTRSPRRHAAHPEPDDPMRDTIIPSKLFALSRFEDVGGHHHHCAEQSRPQATDKYEDETRFPKDQPDHELDDEARVWRVYLEEARSFDQDIVIQASESLELLLVFVRFSFL